MQAKSISTLFSNRLEENKASTYTATHLVIPTSVVHEYALGYDDEVSVEDRSEDEEYKASRGAVYLKKYQPKREIKNPIVFFHGGPGLVNQGQFSELISYFLNQGHTFYVPEIEGSGMYFKGLFPEGFDREAIPPGLNLLELNELKETGLNEFIQNYTHDVKDILNAVLDRHPGQQINLIAHSLGGHQLMRTLQLMPELKEKIGSICLVASMVDAGANRFYQVLETASQTGAKAETFYESLVHDSKRFFKSAANFKQEGPKIDAGNNPAVDPTMNQAISVLYSDLSNFPPILICHAADDKQVFIQGSVLLFNKIKELGGQAHCIFWKTGGHQLLNNQGSMMNVEILNRIALFFHNETIGLDSTLLELSHEDVIAEHKAFLEDQGAYLIKKLG